MSERYTHIHKSNYYEEYKRIRNQLRKYHPFGVLLAGISYLHQPVTNEIEQLQKLPWLVLLLIKWAFIDDQYSVYNRKNITIDKFKKILQMVHDLSKKVKMPSQYSSLFLFMRNVAYQQFLYQQNLNVYKFGRQVDLFLKDSSFFDDKFFSMTGLHIKRFLSLSFVIIARFISQKQKSLNISWFRPLFSEYPKEEVEKFLSLISINIDSIHTELINTEKQQREPYEYYEQTPFIKFPLININGTYWCIDYHILYRCIENYIYDNLRSWNAAKFMDKFGKTFEKYIYKSLHYSGVEFITEQQLKNTFGIKNKIVDFIITETNSNIFVDAKAVEMSYHGKVAQVSEIIKDKISHTIIKAIEQAHEINLQLYQQKSSVRFNSNSYLFVVTFKELYIGNGTTLYKCIAQDKLKKIHDSYPEEVRIPFENMYFITVDEFDILLEFVKSQNLTITDAIEKAKESDLTPQSKKFCFTLHLRSWGANNYPKFLKDSWNNIITPVITTLQGNS